MKMERRCQTCEWAVHPNAQNKSAVCVRWPPHPIIIGVGQPTVVGPKGAPPIPIIRGYFPLVGFEDFCGEYSMRTDGNA